MAWDDYYNLPDNFGDREDFQNDPRLRAFTEFLFGEKKSSPTHADGRAFKHVYREELEPYLKRKYGLQFDEVFDWERWSRWYENGG